MFVHLEVRLNITTLIDRWFEYAYAMCILISLLFLAVVYGRLGVLYNGFLNKSSRFLYIDTVIKEKEKLFFLFLLALGNFS